MLEMAAILGWLITIGAIYIRSLSRADQRIIRADQPQHGRNCLGTSPKEFALTCFGIRWRAALNYFA